MPELLHSSIRFFLELLFFPLFWSINHAPNEDKKRVRFHLGSEFMSLWPFQLGIIAREVYYRKTLKRCGERPIIRFGTLIIHSDAELGSNVWIGNRCVIGLATIGDDVMLSHHVSILSGRRHHRRDEMSGALVDGELTRIRVGESAWIGAHAVVMADLGARAIIGAGTVVTKPVSDLATAVGNPARLL